MNELKEAIKAISGVKCAGECEKEMIGCAVNCSCYNECTVITDFFDVLEKTEADSGKVLALLGELTDKNDRAALVRSYGILCSMKK